MVNKAVISSSPWLHGESDAAGHDDDDDDGSTDRCYGKFSRGVKPSLVTNPSVVFRGIFNYRLNKISVGEREDGGTEGRTGGRYGYDVKPLLYDTSN